MSCIALSSNPSPVVEADLLYVYEVGKLTLSLISPSLILSISRSRASKIFRTVSTPAFIIPLFMRESTVEYGIPIVVVNARTLLYRSKILCFNWSSRDILSPPLRCVTILPQKFWSVKKKFTQMRKILLDKSRNCGYNRHIANAIA